MSGLSIAALTAVSGCTDALANDDDSTDAPAGGTDAPAGGTDSAAPVDTATETPPGTATPTEAGPSTETPTQTERPDAPPDEESTGDAAPTDTPDRTDTGTDDGTTGEPALEARVVEAVTFDTTEERARVHFVDDPGADSVTVETERAVSTRSTDTPAAIEYLDVYPDPAGDDVVVTATLDGESRVVHREGYPPSERVVEDVTYDEDPGGFYDATARVEFTGNQEGDELTVRSTVAGHETTISPADIVTYSVVSIDADGDEVVVSLTNDGETDEVHRERYFP